MNTKGYQIDGQANATEDKSKLDSYRKTSVNINKQIPQLSVMDKNKVTVDGNQIQPQIRL